MLCNKDSTNNNNLAGWYVKKSSIQTLKKHLVMFAARSSAPRLCLIFIVVQVLFAFAILHYFSAGRYMSRLFSSSSAKHASSFADFNQTTSTDESSSMQTQLSKFKQRHKLKRLIIYELLSFMNFSHNPRIFLSCYDSNEWLCTKILKRGSYECRNSPAVHFNYWRFVSTHTAHLYEHNLLPRLKELAKENVLFVDVGANIGLWTVFVASKGFRTVSIEAQPTNFQYLLSNIDLNDIQGNVRAFNFAVGERSGATVYIDNNYQVSERRRSILSSITRNVRSKLQNMVRQNLIDVLPVSAIIWLRFSLTREQINCQMFKRWKTNQGNRKTYLWK